MFIVPQEIYVFPGSLLSQIVYPAVVEEGGREGGVTPEEEARALWALEAMGLLHLCGGITSSSLPPSSSSSSSSSHGTPPSLPPSLSAIHADWPRRLSRGEAQRLALCRVLFHRPLLLFLDEATAGIEREMEAKMYAILREGWGGREGGREGGRVTVVSTGHRESLVGLHDRVVELEAPR